jgi:hypothetical protein
LGDAKIIICIVAVVASALIFIGLASAQILARQNFTNTTPNNAASNNGFWGWIGNCFGYGSSLTVIPQAPANVSASYQSSYYGPGYGPCWAGW